MAPPQRPHLTTPGRRNQLPSQRLDFSAVRKPIPVHLVQAGNRSAPSMCKRWGAVGDYGLTRAVELALASVARDVPELSPRGGAPTRHLPAAPWLRYLSFAGISL
jgi:hypothetical protein